MTDAARNAVHVVAMFGVYVGIIAFITEGYADVTAWLEQRRQRRILASIARIEPIEPDILRRLHARSAYANRRLRVVSYRGTKG